jgi:hypothetical protein
MVSGSINYLEGEPNEVLGNLKFKIKNSKLIRSVCAE